MGAHDYQLLMERRKVGVTGTILHQSESQYGEGGQPHEGALFSLVEEGEGVRMECEKAHDLVPNSRKTSIRCLSICWSL